MFDVLYIEVLLNLFINNKNKVKKHLHLYNKKCFLT